MKNKRMVSCFIAMSLDGYIAEVDGSIDFLEEAQGEGDNGYSKFMADVDTVIMGNKTYRQLPDLMPEYPYTEQKGYVFTRDEKLTSDENVTFIHENPKAFVQVLQQEKGGKIWLIGGHQLIQAFQEEDLVDEWVVTILPTLLGKGIPLFAKEVAYEQLELITQERFGEMIQLTYRKKNS